LIRFANVDPRRPVGFAALIATALIALAAIFQRGAAGVEILPLIAPEELRLTFASTTPALPFLGLIALVVPAVAVWGLRRGAAGDGLRLAVFVLAMVGVLLAQSVAAFFIAWEMMSLVSAFLVGTHHERREVRRALLSYILVSQFGALSIVAALALLGAHAESFRFADIAHAAPGLPLGLRSVIIALMLLGFGSKAGLVPLHFWLPLAHPVAPANASALLSGVMLNVAVYGLLLCAFSLAAPVPLAWGVWVVFVGLLTSITGALYAAIDADFKRLLAYSSIENLGIIASVLGLAIITAALHAPALTELALVALLVHTVSHGVFKSLLFLAAGNVAEAAHTTDLEQLGGLRRVMPLTAPLLLIGCAAAAALPPLTGFASEWLVFTTFFRALTVAPPALAALIVVAIGNLAATSGLAALAFVKLFGIAFLGEQRSVREIAIERPDVSFIGLGWLAFFCIAFGLAPSVLFRRLIEVGGVMSGSTAFDAGALPTLPLLLGALPVLGAIGALLIARRRGVRVVPTWTCGSVVTPRSQYTATAFSKPMRRIFAFVLFPEHQQVRDIGTSRWFPLRIRYAFSTRYVFDEVARNVAAAAQRLARRSRIVQAGLLRVYLVYAVVAVLILLVVAR
jgi:formate hydrogenlyase subunit 3/multisubunit Na+/H+ antiporter MnhD subunit